jgi:hypothetical protein
MRIVNETEQEVVYNISFTGGGDCGTIEVDGYADLPAYDNQSNIRVSVTATGAEKVFVIVIPETGTGQQVEMAMVVEGENT